MLALTLSACLLGFANGMRHALEPDHLAAVSTLVAGERSAKASVRYAAAWGAGHAAMLVVAGGALALLRTELPDVASDALELVVAVVLIALGLRGLAQAARSGRAPAGGQAFTHVHGDHAHAHAGVRDHVHVNSWTLARLPFVVGLVHGLAGSGALAALVASHARLESVRASGSSPSTRSVRRSAWRRSRASSAGRSRASPARRASSRCSSA